MPPLFAKRIMVWIVSVSLLGASLPTVSYAGMIGAETLIQTQQTDSPRARVEEFISRDSVRAQLMALGADPVEVSGRLAALTDEELRELGQNINTVPAGGILAVIGITFVVLLVLELTGTIDIFKKV